MERKQFLIYVTTAAGLMPLLITQTGCASNAQGTEADQDEAGSADGFKVVLIHLNKFRSRLKSQQIAI